ncbi:hypothetical protein [Streptomyces sp. NPDC059564]
MTTRRPDHRVARLDHWADLWHRPGLYGPTAAPTARHVGVR